jgi:hypothetical protein
LTNIFPYGIVLALRNPTHGDGRCRIDDELAETVPGKIIAEQNGVGPEGGAVLTDDRSGGKRKKLPDGHKTEDHSRFGIEDFSGKKDVPG